MTTSPGTYLILGAAGGIGSALCRRLWARGDRVMLAGRDAARLEAMQDQGPSRCHPLDATDFEQVEGAVQAALEFGGGELAGVAHCVGSILLKPAHRTTRADFDGVVAQNLTSAFAVVRACGKLLRGAGSVALCSSAAARVGLANHEAIAAAKAGLEGLVRSAAASYAARGLRFNAVAPGLVDTPMAAPVLASDQARQASERMHPLRRIGEADDIAAALEFLLDPRNSWVSGEVLGVDGGLAGLKPLQRA